MKCWSALLLVMGACAGPPVRPALVQRGTVLSAAAPAAPRPDRATGESARSLQQRAHEVLVRHCAECHAAHRPTALPPALAVFDLDRPDWPERFDGPRFEVALARLQDKPEADRALFRTFRDLQLARR